MSFPVVSHLINKNSNKGVDQVINYMNTNPLLLHKPKIEKNPINEPSVRNYYSIKPSTNSVDPTAYAEYTRDKYHSQDLTFNNYSKKSLIDDLKTGHSNYANDYLHFNPAYLNNDGKPLIRNNTMLAPARGTCSTHTTTSCPSLARRLAWLCYESGAAMSRSSPRQSGLRGWSRQSPLFLADAPAGVY